MDFECFKHFDEGVDAFERFLAHFDPFLTLFDRFGPIWSQKRVKMAQNRVKMGHFWVILDHFWVTQGSFWHRFGLILASFWPHFEARLWALFGLFLTICDPFGLFWNFFRPKTGHFGGF